MYDLSVVEKLKRLIVVPSTTPPGEVRGIVELLLEFAEKTGGIVELQEVSPGQENCILTYDFGQGKTLCFNTHMDVNNPTGQHWNFDPFEPLLRDGALFGLGACDAKGSLAAMLAAIESITKEKSCEIEGKLILTAVMGEEAGGIGSLHLAETGFSADGAVVGEPTSLKVCTAHKGTYMRRIHFRGKAFHSARSENGINAISHGARFCCLYEELSAQLCEKPHPELGSANASVTLISGGTRQNTIPESCQLLIDRRLLPGETKEMADRELDDILKVLKAQIPDLHIEKIEVVVSTVPSETSHDTSIVQAALQSLEQISGQTEIPHGFNAGCDMSKLNLLCGIHTIIFGPGDLSNAHAPNEFVKVDELELAALFYERLAKKFLARSDNT